MLSTVELRRYVVSGTKKPPGPWSGRAAGGSGFRLRYTSPILAGPAGIGRVGLVGIQVRVTAMTVRLRLYGNQSIIGGPNGGIC